MSETQSAKRIAQSDKTKKEYSMEMVETAENLYIYRQKTYEDISALTDVPVVTIQRWSAKYDWRKQRIEHVKRKVDRRRELYILKDELIKAARENSDPQAVYKLATLQRTIDAEERGDQAEQAQQKIDRPQVFLEFMRDLVSFLKDHKPDVLPALEEIFDPFVEWAKQKYS